MVAVGWVGGAAERAQRVRAQAYPLHAPGSDRTLHGRSCRMQASMKRIYAALPPRRCKMEANAPGRGQHGTDRGHGGVLLYNASDRRAQRMDTGSHATNFQLMSKGIF